MLRVARRSWKPCNEHRLDVQWYFIKARLKYFKIMAHMRSHLVVISYKFLILWLCHGRNPTTCFNSASPRNFKAVWIHDRAHGTTPTIPFVLYLECAIIFLPQRERRRWENRIIGSVCARDPYGNTGYDETRVSMDPYVSFRTILTEMALKLCGS